MRCPSCDEKTEVVNSRPEKEGWQIRRRRVCLVCQLTFTTLEFPVLVPDKFIGGNRGPHFMTTRELLEELEQRLET